MNNFINKSKIKNIKRPFSNLSIPRNKKKIWLDKNENLDSKLNKFNNKILNKIDTSIISSYPEAAKLYKKISSLYKINKNELLLTNGSDGGIRMTFEVFVNKNDKVLIMNPSFAMYEVYCKIFRSNYQLINYEIKNKRPFINITTILDKLKKFKPKLFCLANPDSPTGNSFKKTEIIKIINYCRKTNTLLLIDEAYFHFSKSSVIKLIKKYNNLIVVRTFSKAWGVAGIRLGFVASNKKNIELFNTFRPMYEVSSISIAIMEQLIDYPDQMKASVAKLIEGKKYFLRLMKKLNFDGFDTQGNFLFIKFGKFSTSINKHLKKNTLVRYNFNHKSLENYTRFSATSKNNFYKIYKDILYIVKKHNLKI